MILIYLDKVTPPNFYPNKETQLDRLHFFDQLPVQYTVTYNLDEYVASPITKKIAVFYNRLWNGDDYFVSFTQRLDQVKQVSQCVFIVQTELHGDRVGDFLTDNVYAVLPGFVNGVASDRIIFRGNWFEIVTDLYKELPDILPKLDYSCGPREFYFDALLGSYKPNREFVFNAIKKNNLESKIFLNYYSDQYNIQDSFIIPDGVEFDKEQLRLGLPLRHSSKNVTYFGKQTLLSTIVPVDIYNQCAYSIVADTYNNERQVFFTEKIAKPIIAKKLFVVFSGVNYLERLRQLGFKTFGDVVDESYDNIEDNIQRACAAFEQVKYLCQMDQTKILKTIQPVLEHNYQILTQTEWTQIAINKMTKLVLQN